MEAIVKRHAQFQPANGDIQIGAICDKASGDYLVVDSGRMKKIAEFTMLYCTFFQNSVGHVERSNTKIEVIREFLKASVEKENIVLV